MKVLGIFLTILAVTLTGVQNKTKEEWKSRMIYQIVVDRFNPGNNQKPSCDLSLIQV